MNDDAKFFLGLFVTICLCLGTLLGVSVWQKDRRHISVWGPFSTACAKAGGVPRFDGSTYECIKL